MAVDPSVILEAAVAVYKYYKEQDDESRRKAAIQLIIDTIQQAKKEILAELYEVELQALEGEMLGAIKSYQDYMNVGEPVDVLPKHLPSWLLSLELILTNGVIVPLNTLIGQLEIKMGLLGDRSDVAKRAFTLYICVISYRLSVLKEWGKRFNKNTGPSIKTTIDEASVYVEKMKTHLRKASDARFGSIFMSSCPDIMRCFPVYAYSFNGRLIYNDIGFDSIQEQYRYHKQTAFLTYDIVPQLIPFEALLISDRTRNVLDFLQSEEFQAVLDDDIEKIRSHLSSRDFPHLIQPWMIAEREHANKHSS